MPHEYLATPQVLANGQSQNPLADVAGGLITSMGGVSAAVSTATTTTVKSGAGFINIIRVIGGTLGSVTIYDNTAASGTVLLPTVTPVANGVLLEGVSFGTGLTIVTAAATVITVSYR
jgi:phage-related protein